MISRAPVREIVMMVGDDMCRCPVLLEKFRKRVIEGLERSPAAVKEMRTTCMEVSPRRHARQAADIMVVKGNRAIGEALEVRGMDGRRSIRLHRISVQ